MGVILSAREYAESDALERLLCTVKRYSVLPCGTQAVIELANRRVVSTGNVRVSKDLVLFRCGRARFSALVCAEDARDDVFIPFVHAENFVEAADAVSHLMPMRVST